jgi:negative regulator of sigma E activity
MSVVSMAEDAVRREFLATRQTGGTGGTIKSGSENGRTAERWRLQALPPGFMLVSRAPGHMVFSDGKVSMSVFVDHPASPSPTSAGSVSVFERIVHGQRFTVFGDAPIHAVQQLAEAIEADE